MRTFTPIIALATIACGEATVITPTPLAPGVVFVTIDAPLADAAHVRVTTPGVVADAEARAQRWDHRRLTAELRVPAGSARTVEVEMFSAGRSLGQRAIDDVTVIANRATSVAIYESLEPHAPHRESVIVALRATPDGDAVRFELVLRDDTPAVTRWSATSGDLTKQQSRYAEWRPTDRMLATVRAEVEMPTGVSTATLEFDARQSPDLTTPAEALNHAPDIMMLAATKGLLRPGASTDLIVDMRDLDGDPVFVRWHDVDCHGRFSDGTARSPTWTAPAVSPERACSIEVQVTDHRGGTRSGVLDIDVRAPVSEDVLSRTLDRDRAQALGLARDALGAR